MEFIKYLKLDASEKENIDQLLSFVRSELESLYKSEFSHDRAAVIGGVMEKFFEVAIFFDIQNTIELREKIDHLLAVLRHYHSSIPSVRMENCFPAYQELLTAVTKSYLQIRGSFLSLNSLDAFDKLYVPDFSNKQSAMRLILEAIALIESDETLKMKARKQILQNLNCALDYLQNDKTNWRLYFGMTKEIVLILSALASILSGFEAGYSLLEARDKLKQANEIIEKTSINQNYQIYVVNQVIDSHDEQNLLRDASQKLLPGIARGE